eukprot:2861558-Prymnesium_polylepis.1
MPATINPPPRMVCIIFVAGHNDRLEKEIAEDQTGDHEVRPHTSDHLADYSCATINAALKGVPKALLPASRGETTTILGRWWEELNKRQQFKEVFLVTNANKYKYYERWATANDFPVENIVNDGTTTVQSRMGSGARVVDVGVGACLLCRTQSNFT